MAIRTVPVQSSDIASASVFFGALRGMYSMSDWSVLDAFARTGALTIENYKEDVAQVEAWELEEQHKAKLQELCTNVSIGDSYHLLGMAIEAQKQYDMIVVDSPQGLHWGGGKLRTEHFDFLPECLPLLKNTGVLVLYINKQPYDKNIVGSQGYDEYKEYDFQQWMINRLNFYSRNTVGEEVALAAYRALLYQNGFNLKTVVAVPCFSDVPNKEPYAFRLGLEVERL